MHDNICLKHMGEICIDHETQDFINKSVLVLCGAGSDRSKLISDELNERGYMSSHRGVNWGDNKVESQDLDYIGIVIFSSFNEKREFDKLYPKLSNKIQKNKIKVFVFDITESDKNRAYDSNKIDNLKKQISKDLDNINLFNINR